MNSHVWADNRKSSSFHPKVHSQKIKVDQKNREQQATVRRDYKISVTEQQAMDNMETWQERTRERPGWTKNDDV